MLSDTAVAGWFEDLRTFFSAHVTWSHMFFACTAPFPLDVTLDVIFYDGGLGDHLVIPICDTSDPLHV